ncbi:protein SPOR superfamily [Candidatus Termititenax persephonae]|uniref:Protein SPOR superfamily n=1 Tax=Candidatus Termititenax persephonae TaxID=2218525 RepID=A0A388TI65_9BACT|nr:protein SPOR superfamily [Candidatus Termititenax persephonae]
MLDEYTDDFGTNLESKIPEFNGQPAAEPPPAEVYRRPQPRYQAPAPAYQPSQGFVPPVQPVYVAPQPTPPQAPQTPQSVFIYQQPPQPAAPQPIFQPAYPPPAAQSAPPPPRLDPVFNDNSRELNELLKHEQNAGCLKNTLFVIICFLVVIGSFWLSYLVGARFLLPGRNVSSSFSVTRGVNKLKRLMSSQDIVKNETAFGSYTRPPIQQPVVPPEVRYTPAAPPLQSSPPPPAPKLAPPARPKAVPAAQGGTMYRVVVGNFDTKQEAQDVLENIKADGFPVYMYNADGKYRLQIGAFKSKALATALLNKAAEYGYNAFISIK